MIDLHIHTSSEGNYINYDEKQLIDRLTEKGFKAASITLHNRVYENRDIFNYAESKGILLIKGTEAMVEGKEVLIYNITEDERKKIRTFAELRRLKKNKNILIIAPHPFYPARKALGKKLIENIDIFDALEYCYMHHSLFNYFNMKAVKASKRFSKPLIANSDAHFLWQIGNNYSEVKGSTINEIFSNIRKGNIRMHTKPLPLGKIMQVLYYNFIY